MPLDENEFLPPEIVDKVVPTTDDLVEQIQRAINTASDRISRLITNEAITRHGSVLFLGAMIFLHGVLTMPPMTCPPP